LQSHGDRDRHQRSDNPQQRRTDQDGDHGDTAGTLTARPMTLGTNR
jgi:hypothetical protein